MKTYNMPDIKAFDFFVERGFEVSDPDMNYGNGGDAWD